ncbi:plasmid replication protein [Ureibacillus chungkukjangi]|uniref:plasmid replication protein n=1 Tax=Ureibacillus chungkukjangi TaxID=1202712 RepID=UPI00203E0DCF|nr:plasmid replication protein [Ureibacillus chungkukjangi]MCM3390576.1 plasmid replication protein [Ureibacillus chungkukjangi]
MEQTLQNREQQLSHENKEMSFRFGFLGLGMGGTSIASACADVETNITNKKYPYSALLINTNQIDFDKVTPRNPNTVKFLIGDGKGAGRDINMGESLYIEKAEEIDKLVTTQFSQSDFVWLVVGLGGGTGTGSVIQGIKTLMTNGFKKKFGLILTLPRFVEGHTVINNALQRLQKIYAAMQGLGPIILVDNQKLFDEYRNEHPQGSIADYLTYSNKYVADALHDLNTVTASYLPVGEYHFDSSEFRKMLQTPGLIHFARFSAKSATIDAGQGLSYSTKLKQEIDNGVLSSGYNLEQAKQVAVSVLANKSDSKRLYTFEFVEQLESLIASTALAAKEKPVALYEYELRRQDNNVYFYSVFAGLDFPEARISALMDAERQFEEIQKANEEAKKKDLFAGFQASSNNKQSEDLSFDDLFGDKNDDNSSDKLNDDFDDLAKRFNL